MIASCSFISFLSPPLASGQRAFRLATLLALAALAVTLTACERSTANPQNGSAATGGPPPAAPVNVAEVIGRQVVAWDEFTGRVEAVDAVQIRARVSGYLDKINFKEGDEVKKGELLFVIDPRPFQVELERAQAEVERAASRLDLAKSDSERAVRLLKSQAISQEEADTRRAGVRELSAALRSSRAAVQSAKLNLTYTRVTAPVAGRVSRAQITEGNLVDAQGTILTTIVSLDPVYVYFDADERTVLKYIRMARSGERASSRAFETPVEVGLADEDGFPHQGKMNFVDNRVDPNTGTMRGRAVVANAERLFTPGMFARLRLPGTGKQDAVLVNDRAVMTDQSNKFVLVVNAQNQAEYRRVTPGPLVEGMRAIVEGLKPGEKIIVNGLQRVRPGMPVAPQIVSMMDAEVKDAAKDSAPADVKDAAKAGAQAPNEKDAAKAGAASAGDKPAAQPPGDKPAAAPKPNAETKP